MAVNASAQDVGFASFNGSTTHAALCNELEAATAIVIAAAGGTRVGLAEVYDLDPAASARVVNISTRGRVGVGDDVMMGASSSREASNANWLDTQEDEIISDQPAPTDDRESAIAATLSPGACTAIVSGGNNSSGVALIEFYQLQ